MGAHTTSDDPTKYRDAEELTFWSERDPIARFETFLRAKGDGDAFFAESRPRPRTSPPTCACARNALGVPAGIQMFTNVYTEPHPLIDEQAAWLAAYEASYDSARAAA